jgi:manganese/iron transport system permease protein
VIDWLTEPWTFEFMRRALAAGVLVALASSLVGAFVVVRGLSFLTDAVAHSSLAGAAVAFAAGGGATAISAGAVAGAVASALGVAALTRRLQIREDTAIALVFAALFAFAILVMSSVRNYTLELNAFIVGNILGVTGDEIALMAALTLLLAVAVTLFYRELLYAAYDPEGAAAVGVPVAAAQSGLLVLVAIAAVIAFRLVGVVLVMAMLVAPAAAGVRFARSVRRAIAIAAAISLVSTLAGLYVSYYGNLAAGPAIVMTVLALAGALWAADAAVRRHRASRESL